MERTSPSRAGLRRAFTPWKGLLVSRSKPRASELITTNEAAKRLNVHRNTITLWIAEGKLKAYKVGGRLVRIDPDSLDNLVKEIVV
jgi:excisionase family DNA binding protein